MHVNCITLLMWLMETDGSLVLFIHQILKKNKYVFLCFLFRDDLKFTVYCIHINQYETISILTIMPRHQHHITFIVTVSLTLKHINAQAYFCNTKSRNSEDKSCFHLCNTMFITFQKIATFIIHLIAQFCLFVHN
ncbi:hypothetical protein T4B_2293, partial [Trichinella pseudospiralis]